MSVIGMTLLAMLGVLFAARSRSLAPEEIRPPQAAPVHVERRGARAAADGYLGVIIPEEAVDVSSRIEGRLESVKVQVGSAVRQGDILAVVDTRAMRQELAISEAELLSARAERQAAELALSQATERLERREDPRQLELGAISQEELSTARYEQRVATVKLEAARAKVKEQEARVARLQQDIAEATLRAPFDAVVASRHMDAGALVRQGQSLLHLLRSGTRRVRFAVPEQDVSRMAVGLPVRVRMQEQEVPLGGRVSNLAPEVDAASRMMLAVADLEGSGGPGPLPAGSVVRVSVETGTGPQQAPDMQQLTDQH